MRKPAGRALNGNISVSPVAGRGAASQGLTLVELLIALAIFAVVSAMAHSAIRAALEARERIEDRANRLGALQKAMAILERDISQIVYRPIRDENGEPAPALASPGGPLPNLPHDTPYNTLSAQSTLMEFTRGGWQNPMKVKRSHLRRIAYALDDERLLRLSWSVLDRAQDARPSSSVLLTQVNAVAIRFLDGDNEWRSHWPPQPWEAGSSLPGSLPEADAEFGPGADTDLGGELPKGIEITLDVEHMGRIERLLVLSP